MLALAWIEILAWPVAIMAGATILMWEVSGLADLVFLLRWRWHAWRCRGALHRRHSAS